MFDVGFWELGLIFVVALLVLGPERMPEMARSAGRWVRKIKALGSSISAEIERELEVTDLRKELEQKNQQIMQQAESLAKELNQPVESLQSLVRSANDKVADVEQGVRELQQEVISQPTNTADTAVDSAADANVDEAATTMPSTVVEAPPESTAAPTPGEAEPAAKTGRAKSPTAKRRASKGRKS